MTATKTRPASPAPAEVGVAVGDFFSSSWGYDQTNVDFYKVVGLTPKGVKVQKWSSAVASSNGPCDYVVPGDGPATYTDWSACTEEMDYWDRQEAKVERPAPVVTKRLRSFGGDYVSFSVNSYSSASKWDGKPEYATASGYGH
jgi:hypothetical protein